MQDLRPKLVILAVGMVLFVLGFLPDRNERRDVPKGDALLDESVPSNSPAPEADENGGKKRIRYAALVRQGDTHFGNRDFDRAISDYSEAIQLDPMNAIALHNRGLAYANKSQNDEAITDYSEAIRLDPTNALALHNRGLAYANKRQYDEAIADYSEAIRLDPTNALALHNRGLAYANKREYDRAIAD